MAFPKQYAEFAARARVPLGFVIVALFLWLARPTMLSLIVGGLVALDGLLIRAWAAGHLRKNQELAVSGPYAYVRNPLYVGTLTVGIGFAVAGAHPAIGLALVVFFLALYLPVIEEEEAADLDTIDAAAAWATIWRMLGGWCSKEEIHFDAVGRAVSSAVRCS